MDTLCDRRLKRWYSQFNERFFDDALPHDTDVLYAPVKGCCAEVYKGEGGFVLTINPAYALDTSSARLSLLHEMAHMKLWPLKTHGPIFEREILRLVNAGAYKGLL